MNVQQLREERDAILSEKSAKMRLLVVKAFENGIPIHFGCRSLIEHDRWVQKLQDEFPRVDAALKSVGSVIDEVPHTHLLLEVEQLY